MMVVVLLGCGGSEPEPLRTRFEERASFPSGTEWRVHGAFDWETMHGFFSEQDLSYSKLEGTREIVQIGSRCFERRDGNPWHAALPADSENTLCHLQFQNPRTEVELLRAVSSEWTKLGSTHDTSRTSTWARSTKGSSFGSMTATSRAESFANRSRAISKADTGFFASTSTLAVRSRFQGLDNPRGRTGARAQGFQRSARLTSSKQVRPPAWSSCSSIHR